MPYLRCTGKLLKQVGADAAARAREDSSSESDEDWYANLVWMERRKCVLFTNVGTLYPFIVLDVRKPQLRALSELFRQEYERNLIHLGATRGQIAQELLKLGDLRIGRSHNRRVLGSMNDYAYQAEVYVEMFGGVAVAESMVVNERMAEAPMSAIGYSSGIRELKKRLATYAA